MLRKAHGKTIIAFGDSPVDLDLMKASDTAFVIVGLEEQRSTTMPEMLDAAIHQDGLRVRQVLLPRTHNSKLNIEGCYEVDLHNPDILEEVFKGEHFSSAIDTTFATPGSNAAKLLMTPMRDAANAGPALREAHRQVGWFLAMQYVCNVVGTETYRIQHVDRSRTDGHRLSHEQQTLIVALMRGGEPMALGISDAFPQAEFLHAFKPDDIKLHHARDNVTVILVDSVVNSGNTLCDFVRRIRQIHGAIRIVAVAGVVHSGAIERETNLGSALAQFPNFSLIGLRTSENQYRGQGTTDTGNRLFNTPYL